MYHMAINSRIHDLPRRRPTTLTNVYRINPSRRMLVTPCHKPTTLTNCCHRRIYTGLRSQTSAVGETWASVLQALVHAHRAARPPPIHLKHCMEITVPEDKDYVSVRRRKVVPNGLVSRLASLHPPKVASFFFLAGRSLLYTCVSHIPLYVDQARLAPAPAGTSPSDLSHAKIFRTCTIFQAPATAL